MVRIRHLMADRHVGGGHLANPGWQIPVYILNVIQHGNGTVAGHVMRRHSQGLSWMTHHLEGSRCSWLK